MGGKSVLIQFNAITDLDSCCNRVPDWINSYFEVFKIWEDGDFPSDRVCWVHVFGTPPQAWNADFFSLIAVRFGSLLHVDLTHSGGNRIDVAKLMILTSDMMLIHSSFSVPINGKSFTINVEEAQPCLSCCSPSVETTLAAKPTSSHTHQSSSSSPPHSSPSEVVQTSAATTTNQPIPSDNAISSDPFGILDVVLELNNRYAMLSNIPHADNTMLSNPCHAPNQIPDTFIKTWPTTSLDNGKSYAGIPSVPHHCSLRPTSSIFNSSNSPPRSNNPFPCLVTSSPLTTQNTLSTPSWPVLQLVNNKQEKKMKRINNYGSVDSIQSTNSDDIRLVNRIILNDTPASPPSSHKSCEVEHTMVVGNAIGWDVSDNADDIEGVIGKLVDKEVVEWVRSRTES
ncbi:hypothetical protein Tsubulata_022986 [Turnera subulata]|uniref:DUF4283 domain-containing protein n=1 Tax=Turnera subulata TaxID=218843 RepID=A0A9Q0FK13_9ROSI|nr:hypothetical protein Tsubulata_022986 [Turnera subulata]